ncbi:MAG: ELWxxDGT repeat protein [Acidimicrobiales bacterium]
MAPQTHRLGKFGHVLLTALVVCTLVATAIPASLGNPAVAQPRGQHFDLELVKDIRPGPFSSDLGQLNEMTVFGDSVLFLADDGIHGLELWISDGTEGGTRLVKDISPGDNIATPPLFTVLGDRALFRINQAGHGVELWTTDGTEAGTQMVKDISPGPESSWPRDLTRFGDRVLFTVVGSNTDPGLWISDGTSAGTGALSSVHPVFATARLFVQVGQRLVFRGYDDAHGAALWTSDLTTEGTNLLVELAPGPMSAGINELARLGNGVLFTTVGSSGTELFFSDLTQTGTQRLANVYPKPHSPYPAHLTIVGDRAVFTAGPELWMTDGTVEGTNRLTAPAPFGSSDPADYTVLGNTILFSAVTPHWGRELWVTDGTEAGTVLVKDIKPGTGSSSPRHLTVFGDQVFFYGDDGPHSAEPWVTDGTQAGTMMVGDLNPGTAWSSPESFTVLGDRLLFAADDGVHGRELWSLTRPEPDPLPSSMADATTLDDLVLSEDYEPDVHGHILRLYPAFFGREADLSGAKYWIIDVHDTAGASLDQITTYFANDEQPEFLRRYEDIATDDHRAYLSRIYHNMLGRSPDSAGFSYWLAFMASGELDRAGVVRYVALDTEFINRYPYRP